MHKLVRINDCILLKYTVLLSRSWGDKVRMNTDRVTDAADYGRKDELAAAMAKIALLTRAGNNLHRLIIDLGTSEVERVMPNFRDTLEDWQDVIEGRYPAG